MIQNNQDLTKAKQKITNKNLDINPNFEQNQFPNQQFDISDLDILQVDQTETQAKQSIILVDKSQQVDPNYLEIMYKKGNTVQNWIKLIIIQSIRISLKMQNKYTKIYPKLIQIMIYHAQKYLIYYIKNQVQVINNLIKKQRNIITNAVQQIKIIHVHTLEEVNVQQIV